MKKIIFFDFDGVIADSLELAYQLSVASLEGPLSREQHRALFEGNVYDGLEKYAHKPEMDDKAFFKMYSSRLEDVLLFPGIPEALKSVHDKYRNLFVISSTATDIIQDYLKRHGLDRHFEDILGSDVHRKKTVKMRGVLNSRRAKPDDAVMVTDTLGDIREASSIGVGSIAVAWGFHEEEVLLRGNPHRLIETPKHLPQAIDDYFAR